MDFRGDERGQPVLIGTLLVFVILVLAFSGYQAVVVPQQNADVEFQHDQNVQPQFLDLRNAAMRAAASGTSPFESIKLGTEYPARLIALNPPDATGTIRTTDARPIEVSGVASPCRGGAETRFLEYEAAYNEFGGAPTYRFENTVAYRQFESDTRVDTEQRLIADRTINIVPIRGNLSRSGTGAVSVEPVAGIVKRTDVTDPVVTVPTELNESKWETLLADEVDEASVNVTEGELTVELDGTYTVRCAPIAFDSPPESGTRSGGSIDEPEQPGIINPRGAHGIVLAGVDDDNAQSGEVTLFLLNRGDETRTIEEARVPFHYGTPVEEFHLGDDELRVRGDFVTLTDPIDIAPEELVEITLEDPDGGDIRGDFTSFGIRDDRDLELTYAAEVTGTAVDRGETGAASDAQLVNDPTAENDSDSEVHFDIENTGNDPITVKGISIDNTTHSTAAAVSRDNPQPEVVVDGNGTLSTPNGIEIGTGEEPFDQNATIDPGTVSHFELIEFVDSTGGSGQSTSMTGEDVTLTLYFTDGSSKQFTLEDLQ